MNRVPDYEEGLARLARCTPYNSFTLRMSADFLVTYGGIPEDRVVPVLQVLTAPDLAGLHSLEFITEFVTDILSGEHSLC